MVYFIYIHAYYMFIASTNTVYNSHSLQGGYNLNSISESFSSCVDVMLGGAPPRIKNVDPDPAAVKCIKNVITVHKKYWKSLCCDGMY